MISETMLSETTLTELSEFIGKRTGLCFPKERWGDLERSICSASAEFGFKDVETCIEWLVSSPLTKQEVEILASNLTVGETYFFRDKKSFEVVEERILPGLISSRMENDRNLRIWSTGCSTGEEAYSIAILIHKMIPRLKDWNITILATDINPHFLKKAQKGIYTEWSFRDAPAWIKKYFRKTKHGLEIHPEIKKMVKFSYHNLAEDSYPSLLNNTAAMDIIFCRNVLMYFSPERVKQVIDALYLCLVEGGWLMVSPAETSSTLFSQYVAVNFQGALFYKKGAGERKGDIIPGGMYQLPEKICIAPVRYVPKPAFREERPLMVEGRKPAAGELYKEAFRLYGQGRYMQVAEKLAGCDHDTKSMILLAKAYANCGKSASALEWCEKALAHDRMDPYCHYLHAMILQERGQVEEAVKSLKHALYLDQDFVLAHFALGNLNRQLEKFGESDRYFGTALAILRKFSQDDILPESDGITAGRLSEIITSIKGKGILHERQH